MVYVIGSIILWLIIGYLAGFLFHHSNLSDWKGEDEHLARILILTGPIFLLAVLVVHGAVRLAKWSVGTSLDEEHS